MAELTEEAVKSKAPTPSRLPPRKPTRHNHESPSVTKLPINPEKSVEYEAPMPLRLPPRRHTKSKPSAIQEEPVKPKLPLNPEISVECEPPTISELPVVKLQCSLCQDTLQEPKLLPCLHTFCRIPCLERIVVNDNGRQSLTCPTCQRIVPLTDDGVAKLQTDFHAENMLKGQETLKKSKKTEHGCENCKKSSAVTYCQECKKFMCEKCQEMHQMWGDFSEHKLLDDIKSLESCPITAAAKCEKHEKREAMIFCETCSELICGDCALIQHKGHLCNLIDDVFPRHKEEFVAGVKPVQEMVNNIQEALNSINSLAKEICDQKATLEADICRHIDQLHQILDQRKEELLTILDRITQQKLSDLTSHKEKVEMIGVKTSRCLDYATGCLHSEQKDEVLKMKAPVLQRIVELKAKFDTSVCIQPKIMADIKYVSNDRAIEVCKEYGDIVCESQTHAKENSYVDLDCTHFEVDNNPSYQLVSYDNRRLSKLLEQEGSLATPVGESRATNGPIRCNKPVIVIKGLRGLAGVAINSRQQIIIIDDSKHKVLLIAFTGKKISSFGKQGSSKGHFKRPSGVAVDNYDYIYITDRNNHRIQRFTSDGKFITAVGSRGRGRLQFTFPIGICFNKTNNLLYVCDQENHRIQVLTTHLLFVRSIGSPGGGNGKLNYPTSCAFDSSNNLYVADCGNNCVQVFTSKGEFLHSFINKCSLEKPFAIAIDGKDNVYVSERDRDHLKILNTQGDHVSSFGESGSNEGQFRDIRNIYFNGNMLIVSDFSNNRIQMFVVV